MYYCFTPFSQKFCFIDNTDDDEFYPEEEIESDTAVVMMNVL